MTSTHAVDMNWVHSQGAYNYLDPLFHKGTRRQFGLLQRPILPSHINISTIDFKIFVCGKSGVGKSATISKLSGAKIPSFFSETAGIETTSVYWPVFVSSSNKILYFRLNFWDVGDNIIKKFDHILPACMHECDCVLYLFSLTDRSSFEDIPQIITRHSHEVPPAKLILATRADQYIHSDISDKEIQEMSHNVQTPVVRIKNISKSNATMESELSDISGVLNNLCNTLWLHEQHKYNVTQRNVLSV